MMILDLPGTWLLMSSAIIFSMIMYLWFNFLWINTTETTYTFHETTPPTSHREYMLHLMRWFGDGVFILLAIFLTKIFPEFKNSPRYSQADPSTGWAPPPPESTPTSPVDPSPDAASLPSKPEVIPPPDASTTMLQKIVGFF